MRVGITLLLFVAALGAEDDRAAIRVKDKALQTQIHTAIGNGIAYLKAIQQGDGSWGRSTRSHAGGYTALAIYALAASGVDATDPVIVKGLSWIAANKDAYGGGESAATYANSLLVMALTRVDPKAHRKLIHAAAKRIERGERSSGFWSYTLGRTIIKRRVIQPGTKPEFGAREQRAAPGGRADNSNTQFAVLALWAAESIAGYDVKPSTWKQIFKHFRKGQQDDGAWGYTNSKRDPRATMTAAGIVSMVYSLVALDGRPKAIDLVRRDLRVRAGYAALKRMARGWQRRGPKGISVWGNYYWIYSLERVGTVLALDPEDWYVEGARHLIEQQQVGGRWGRMPTSGGAYETSLALLFLTRATYPPIKGAVTPRDKPRPKAAVTSKEKFPDVTTQGGLARAFFQYVEFKAEQRALILPEFSKAGPRAIGLFVEKLRDKRLSVRRGAMDLLNRLLAKPLLFDPAAKADERATMIVPIDAWWKRAGAALRWDAARGKFG